MRVVDFFTLALCAVFTLACALDFYSTKLIIGIGGRELNPVVKWLIDKAGLAFGLLIAKALGLVPVWVLWYAGAFAWTPAGLGIAPAPVGLALLCAFYVGIVANNFREIRKQRQINAPAA